MDILTFLGLDGRTDPNYRKALLLKIVFFYFNIRKKIFIAWFISEYVSFTSGILRYKTMND